MKAIIALQSITLIIILIEMIDQRLSYTKNVKSINAWLHHFEDLLEDSDKEYIT